MSDLEGLAVSSQASAAAAITKIDDAFTDLADKRADLGAYMNRLGHALGNAETFAANMPDSNSRIVDQTKWNKMDLLNGDGPGDSAGQGGVFIIQVGADNSQTMTVTIGNLQITSAAGSDLLSDLEGLAVSSQASAAAAITKIDDALLI